MKVENGTDVLDSWFTSVEYDVLHWSSIVVPPPIIATGIVGNPLAAVVLARLPPPPSDSSAARYAVALLVAGTVRLFAEGTLEWFAYVTGSSYVMHQADWICRVWKFLRTSAPFLQSLRRTRSPAVLFLSRPRSAGWPHHGRRRLLAYTF